MSQGRKLFVPTEKALAQRIILMWNIKALALIVKNLSLWRNDKQNKNNMLFDLMGIKSEVWSLENEIDTVNAYINSIFKTSCILWIDIICVLIYTMQSDIIYWFTQCNLTLYIDLHNAIWHYILIYSMQSERCRIQIAIWGIELCNPMVRVVYL